MIPVPTWILWLLGGAVVVTILFFAVVGVLIIVDEYRRPRW